MLYISNPSVVIVSADGVVLGINTPFSVELTSSIALLSGSAPNMFIATPLPGAVAPVMLERNVEPISYHPLPL